MSSYRGMNSKIKFKVIKFKNPDVYVLESNIQPNPVYNDAYGQMGMLGSGVTTEKKVSTAEDVTTTDGCGMETGCGIETGFGDGTGGADMGDKELSGSSSS